MKTTILVVDDESKVRSMLDEVLTGQGFRVVLARDGHEALFVAEHEQSDLILLDIMMPQLDGYQFLRRYRRERNTPVIILTAKEEESDAVIGFELGADDYVIKPFRMRELIARIHAVLRRYRHQQQSNERVEVGDVLLE
jgi:DNA-binding response OmpR family regulator